MFHQAFRDVAHFDFDDLVFRQIERFERVQNAVFIDCLNVFDNIALILAENVDFAEIFLSLRFLNISFAANFTKPPPFPVRFFSSASSLL